MNSSDCDETGMPTIEPTESVPKSLLPFNYATTAKDKGTWLHFFIDDYRFERLWRSPEANLPLISSFEGVLSPDFSLYMDMPLPMQRWNEYRRRALARWWQSRGVDVIPTLSWSVPESYGFCFGGLPKGATYAASTVGVGKDTEAARVWHDGMDVAIKELEPKRLVLYGSDIGHDFGGVEVIRFGANTAFGMRPGETS